MSIVAARTGTIVRAFPARKRLDEAGLLDRLASAPGVTIVIPVFNGGDTVRTCVRSVVNHTHGRRIVLLDDASDDPLTLAVLAEAEDELGVEVIRNRENLGYTRNANRAIELAGEDDVVLLNSDTEVGPLWVENLRWAAYSRANAASASAVSDNAGAFAMPVAGRANEWPEELATDDIARHVVHSISPLVLEAPTAHGFCVYLRRDALDAVGVFDVASFPRGYGEENDWSMRALGAGMHHLVATRVFVRHSQGVSFGSGRDQLIAAARETVDALHPSYRPLVGEWMSSAQMTDLRAEFDRSLKSALSTAARPRVMYVIHSSGGGTPETNRDLMDGLLETQQSYLLVVSERLVRFERWRGGSSVVLAEWRPDEPFSLRDAWRPDYAAFVAQQVVSHGIELIHVRHLINQPLTTVAHVSRLLNVPMILSTHDFYYICPTVHLLDQNRTFCGGVCTPGEGPCTLPTPFTRGAPELKHNWIHEWRRRASEVLDISRAVVATTPSAARIYAENYPAYAGKLELIEHGRQVDSDWARLREGRARRPGPLRVAAPASWDTHKGVDFVRRLIELTEGRVEWHILGTGSSFAGDGAVVHGQYTRAGMRAVLDQIDPDYIGLFSIWPETYSHTLTEAWALGVPVLATDLGAIADRVRQHGGGELFPVDEPGAVARFVLDRARELAAGVLDEGGRAGAIPRRSVRSRMSMAQDYAALYEQNRENLPRPTVGYIVQGEGGNHTGSTHVRLRRRMLAANARDLRFRAVNVSDLIAGRDGADYRALIVQRDIVGPDQTAEFLSVCRDRGIPLIVELDDDLLSDHARERLIAGGYDPRALDALAEIVEAADLVTVSTATLAERVSAFSSRVEVVLNELDIRLWGEKCPERPVGDEAGPVSVVYIGSRTHTEDLELLRPVFDGLTTSDGRQVRLSVVGVTDDDAAWFDRVPILPGATAYPRFAPWLHSIASQWELGVAPLTETEFNDAKSDLKFLEYSLLGLPTIASAVRPYAGLEEQGILLVPNETDVWRKAIVATLDDRQAARDRASRAENYARAHRTISRGAAGARWIELVRGLAAAQPIKERNG